MLAVGAGGGCLDIFSLIYHFSILSPSLWETVRYRLKYCLKGPLSPKQPTNQLHKIDNLSSLKRAFVTFIFLHKTTFFYLPSMNIYNKYLHSQLRKFLFIFGFIHKSGQFLKKQLTALRANSFSLKILFSEKELSKVILITNTP